MQLTKTEEEHYQSIDYFVREKLRKGAFLTSSELWAKEWMDLHAQSYKRPEEVFYKTYHTIPKCVQVWEKRMNLKPSIPKEKKAKKEERGR